jgi:predicted ATPase/DNA-binding CsgD family transcriptional regulator
VPQAVAAVLDVQERPGQPILHSLVDSLRSKKLLLVMDNCEHVIEACAQLAEALLRACVDLNILATSREALGITGESVWTVPSLSLPDAPQHPPSLTELSQYEAVRLFVERAVAVQPGFKLTDQNAAAVTQICQRLDGIPLAIELAAARVKVLKPAEIAARLDDGFSLLTLGSRTAIPRHQTLRAAMDWSYGLLTESERVLLRRLAVFAGGCTLAAAEFVCSDNERSLVGWQANQSLMTSTTDNEGAEHAGRPPSGVGFHSTLLRRTAVLDLLSHLVDKSLVIVEQQSSDTHFYMLETIREYARLRLEESSEAEAVRQLHAEFFLNLAERVQPTMSSDERKARYARFDAEQDNFRAALAWMLAGCRAEPGLRLVGALGEYWFWWAHRWHEGWEWISKFLALPEATTPKRARAAALKAAVNILRYRGDLVESDHLADESLALFRELGDKSGMAWVLVEKAINSWTRADYPEVVKYCDESAALFREIGEPRGLGWALQWLAVVAEEQGHFEKATALFTECIAAAEAAGDDAMAGIMHICLGDVAYDTGDYARAADLRRRAIALCREGGNADGATHALVALARTTLAQGDLDGAASQYETVEASFRQAGEIPGLCGVLHHLGYVRHLRGDDRAASALLREALTLQQQQQSKRLMVQSLERCAWIAADTHQPQRAARLFGAAEAARKRIRAPLLGDKPFYDRHLARARGELDKPTFDAAWAEGRAMTLEGVTENVIAELDRTDAVPVGTQTNKERFGRLTARERDVAARIAQAKSNREIAQELVVSERTVETHVANILNKLGFTSRAQIRKWARDKGLAPRDM